MAGFGDKNSWEVEEPAAAPAQAPKAIQPDPGFHERGPSRQAIAHEPGHNERGPSRQAIAHEKGPYVSPHNKPKPFSHRAGNHHPQRNGAHAKTGKRSNPAAQTQQQRTKLSPTAKHIATPKNNAAPSPLQPQRKMSFQTNVLPPNLADDQIENGIVMQGMQDYASKKQFQVYRSLKDQPVNIKPQATPPSARDAAVAQAVNNYGRCAANYKDGPAIREKCAIEIGQLGRSLSMNP